MDRNACPFSPPISASLLTDGSRKGSRSKTTAIYLIRLQSGLGPNKSSASSLKEITKLIEQDLVVPWVEAVFPLPDAEQALALFGAGRARVRSS